MKLKALIAPVLTASLLATLAACGGGGGSPGVNTAGSSPVAPPVTPETPPTADSKVTSFVYQLDKNSVANSGGDKATLTVTALDGANNPVSGATVNVAVDSGVYTPGSTITDDAGQVNGAITVGGDKANRNITAKVTVNGKSSTIVIPVVGSKLALTPVPAVVAPGGSTTVSVKATDANDSPIPNVTVKLGGTLGFNQSVTTDLAGNANATLAAVPAAAGSYTITASGLGVDATREVQVISLTGGAIPLAIGPISAANLNISPNTIAPNATGASTNVARLRAVFQNASNQAVQNVRVRFVIAEPGLGSGEKISTGNSIVYSDGSGVASADYIAGTRSSPTNGVRIVACYALDDVTLAGVPAAGAPCPAGAQQTSATLTVNAQPLSVTIGVNNEIEKGAFNLTYIKKFDVAVADAAGNAVSGAQISASVDLVDYGKGVFSDPQFWCANEDLNRNGFLDQGEDRNGNGSLEPRKADLVLSFVGANVTGANGRMQVQVEYPQNVGNWLRYDIKVTTNVAGSEGTAIRQFVTAVAKEDVENGSFLRSPYGLNASCIDPK